MNMHGEYLKAFARYSRQRLSGKEWEALLRNAEEMGISQLQITEASGCAVFDFVSDRVRKGAKILILCGTGFLGGCGFAAARYLCTEYNIAVAAIGAKAGYSDAAMKNRFILQHLPSVGVLYDAADEAGKFASEADVIIDALADIKEGDAELGRIVMQVNRHKKKGCKMISLDFPSGMGKKEGWIMKSEVLTLHKEKTSPYKINIAKVANVGIPADVELLCGPGDVKIADVCRDVFTDKRGSGNVVVIGGSESYHGAQVMAAEAAKCTLAALRSGAGYAKLIVPKAVESEARAASPNLIVKSFGEKHIGAEDVDGIWSEARNADCIVIGMGMGRLKETIKASMEIIDRSIEEGKKIVIDADAIYAVKSRLSDCAIVTPQRNEFIKLGGMAYEDSNICRKAEATIRLAKKLGCTVLLKGHYTTISDGGLLKVNIAGDQSLATMGTGDVLSGIIGGIAARGASVFSSGAAAAYMHAKIGMMMSKRRGKYIIAADIIEGIREGFDEAKK